jgi:hypothetical protein
MYYAAGAGIICAAAECFPHYPVVQKLHSLESGRLLESEN